MNALLWIVQAVLALLYFAGGAYKVFSFDEVARHLTALPRSGWRFVGVVEMIGAVLLVVPMALKRGPRLTSLAAGVLAVETFALAALYAAYSLAFTASNPLVWSVVMGLLVVFVAYGRSMRRPAQRQLLY